MKAFGYLFISAVMAAYGYAVSGFTLAKLWLWFMVPTFGLPVLSIPAAVGLGLVAAYLTHQINTRKDERPYWEQLFTAGLVATIWPAVILTVGFVVKHWL